MEKAVGCQSKEVLGRLHYEILGRADSDRECPVREVFADGQTHTAELVLRDHEWGRDRRWLSTASPVLDDEGTLVACVEVLKDITALKGQGRHRRGSGRALKAGLREGMEQVPRSEADYRRLIESIPDIVYTVFPSEPFRLGFISQSIEGMCGLRPEEFFRRPELRFEIVHPDDRLRVRQEVEKSLKEAGGVSLEYRVVHKNDLSRISYVIDHFAPVRDEESRVLLFQGLLHDITERKKSENETALVCEELEKRVHDLSTLYRLTGDMESIQQPDDLLPKLAALVGEATHCDRVASILSFREADGNMSVAGAFGIEEGLAARLAIDPRDERIIPFLEGKESTVFRDLSRFPEFYEAGVRSFFIAPVHIEGEPRGSLVLCCFGTEAISGKDETLLRDAAERVGHWIEKKEGEKKVRQRVTDLSILNEVSEALLSIKDPQEVLRVTLVAATAYQGFGFNRAFLFLLGEGGGFLEGRLATGPLSEEDAGHIWNHLAQDERSLKCVLDAYRRDFDEKDVAINELVRSVKIPLEGRDNIFARALKENKPVNVRRGKGKTSIPGEMIDFLRTEDFALVPLVSKERCFGALLVDNYITKKPITDRDVSRLRIFANQASLAIETSHLYESLEEKVKELSRAYEDLQRNRDKMLAVERLSAVGEVAAKVTHEIRNPLVAIGGFARRLLKTAATGEMNTHYLDIIITEIQRLETIVSDILYFARPAPPTFEHSRLDRIIEGALDVLAPEFDKRGITVQTRLSPGLVPIALDPTQMSRVFLSLFRNAMEAMHEGGVLSVSSMTDNGQWVNVEVADTGVGIPDEDLDKVFNAFYTRKSTGSGLGLTVSAQIVHNHGGEIEVKKGKEEGSLFILKLPLHRETQA
jgi:PAS domain S-box-containing protein